MDKKLQPVFDRILAHLRKQGHAATTLGSCVYRATNGDKCAVGCLIPEHLYHPGMEGKGSHLLMSTSPELVKHLNDEFGLDADQSSDLGTLLAKWQGFHDQWEGEVYVLEQWASVQAKDWGLVYTPPTAEANHA